MAQINDISKMKQIICILLLAVFMPIRMRAQKNDSIINIEDQVSLPLKSLTKISYERDQAIRISDSLRVRCNELLKCNQKDKELLESKSSALNKYIEENKQFRNLIGKSDTCFINFTSNFLYIPYEAFSVEKIAIPAFEKIFNADLKQKNLIKYDLLKRYQNDIRLISQFLKEIQADLNKPFAKNDAAIQKIKLLKEQEFYTSYMDYKDYKNTYLGKIFNEIIIRLSKHDGNINKVDFRDIQSKLNSCLKTVEDL